MMMTMIATRFRLGVADEKVTGGLATAALQSLENETASVPSATLGIKRHRPMITFQKGNRTSDDSNSYSSHNSTSTGMKRSRSSLGSFALTSSSCSNFDEGSCEDDRPVSPFDMTTFARASEQVEDSMWFPQVEWPSIDDGEEAEEDREIAAPIHKKLCRGLVRSSGSADLSSLITSGTRGRFGSNGSLC